MYHVDSEVRRQMAREHAEELAREYRPMPAAPEAEARPAEAGARASLRRLRHAYRA